MQAMSTEGGGCAAVEAQPITARIASGHTIVIDAQDAALLERYTWRTYNLGGGLKVVASVPQEAGAKRKRVQLSRLITQAGARRRVLHKNGDPLDLRRENLQVAQPHPCPLSRETLGALYAESHRPFGNIARCAAEVAGWDTLPPRWMIDQWLRAAGIQLRPPPIISQPPKNVSA